MITPEMVEAAAPFIAIGFVAQLVDGALGMAFGIINSTLLVSVLGIAPARASAMIHTVEAFTTGASAISHTLHRNVDWKLFLRLAVPGAIGGAAGAYMLSNIDGSVARPFVMAYLTGLGLYLLYRSWTMTHPREPRRARFVGPLGLVGAFLDAAGGGGWGPIVTSNLLVQGTEPRRTIGTVNTVEFVVTSVISATFIATIGFAAFTTATIGILIGGLVAAPFGAHLAKRIPAPRLLLMVGIVLTATSIFSLWRALAGS